MEKQENRVLVIEVFAGDTQYGGTFRMDGAPDEKLFIKACTKFVMVELRRQGIRPDRMRTYVVTG